MRYSNPDRRTILKTMTSLAAASSMTGITVGRAGAAAAADPALSPALLDVDQALRQAVNARTVPGLVAIAANDKGIVYEGAFGPSITADSVFWIASMTKAITGAAAMQLVEQGKLQLDQPMGKLLPQLEQPKVLEGFDASGAPKLRPAKRAITLRHLRPTSHDQTGICRRIIAECQSLAPLLPLLPSVQISLLTSVRRP